LKPKGKKGGWKKRKLRCRLTSAEKYLGRPNNFCLGGGAGGGSGSGFRKRMGALVYGTFHIDPRQPSIWSFEQISHTPPWGKQGNKRKSDKEGLTRETEGGRSARCHRDKKGGIHEIPKTAPVSPKESQKKKSQKERERNKNAISGG